MWDKIKNKYNGLLMELGLTLLFLGLFLAALGPRFFNDTILTSAAVKLLRETESEMMTEEETEEVTETCTEEEGASMEWSETEPETNAAVHLYVSERVRKHMERVRLDACYGRGFVIPMITVQGFEQGAQTYPGLLTDKSWEMPEYPIPEISQRYADFSLLQDMLEMCLEEYDGNWSVYFKDLGSGQEFAINEQPMYSASVMKLFVMGTVYKAIEAGDLERTDTVTSLLEQMISASDNESSNELLRLLGEGSYANGIMRVNEFIAEYGFSSDTIEYNGFNNASTVMDPDNFNQVTARDCGKLLEDIYRRNWVSREISNEIEQMMMNQHTRYKIPKGIPEGVTVCNKTGEMDNTENDAAIVYSEHGDYILVVLSNMWNSKDQAITRIQNISRIVYEHMNAQ